MKHLTFLLITFLTLQASHLRAQFITIQNGIEWIDDDGKVVQAHGGNFLQVGNKWYLIGEDRARSWNPDVNLYSTEDFVHWHFEGKIIKNHETHPELQRQRNLLFGVIWKHETTAQAKQEFLKAITWQVLTLAYGRVVRLAPNHAIAISL